MFEEENISYKYIFIQVLYFIPLITIISVFLHKIVRKTSNQFFFQIRIGLKHQSDLRKYNLVNKLIYWEGLKQG